MLALVHHPQDVTFRENRNRRNSLSLPAPFPGMEAASGEPLRAVALTWTCGHDSDSVVLHSAYMLELHGRISQSQNRRLLLFEVAIWDAGWGTVRSFLGLKDFSLIGALVANISSSNH